ncbi:hypothetical protein QBC44DRAFT_244530 [Cladorrhinum sp. PSN332]|nr:hypothetical protein QBC44DRAFT_244530 [Cladorrhinum sp. PSN332]
MTEATSAIVTAISEGGGGGSGNANANVTAAAASAGGAGPGEGNSSSPSSSSPPSSSSNTAGRRLSNYQPRTLSDVMREPSTTIPEVVVLDSITEDRPRHRALNPKEDLWLTTADGRYSSSIIPLRVGNPSYFETFHVHKHVLLRYAYFEKALCGGFLETETQSMDFPEEDPAIFHFLVAYLYEGRYEPIKPVASVLGTISDDKGKAILDGINDPGADSDASSTSSINSDASLNNHNPNPNNHPVNQHPALRERHRRERQRRREDRHFERLRQKHPGIHRPSCNCPQCLSASGPPCWSCRAPRAPPPPPPPPPALAGVFYDRPHQERERRRRPRPQNYRGAVLAPPPPPPPPPPVAAAAAAPHASSSAAGQSPPARITGEDLSTWLLAYELDIDVYILANKFCLFGFMKLVARSVIDLLESAGQDAAVPQVLYLCSKIYSGLPETDPLLKMIFARVGFLQPWRKDDTQEANEWLVTHPEIASLLLMEMAARRDVDDGRTYLPSMESLEGGGAYGNYSGGPQGVFSEWAGTMMNPGLLLERGNGGRLAQWMGAADNHGYHNHHGHPNVRGPPVPYVHGGGMWPGGVGRRMH